MSERTPGSAPKPRPPREEWENALERLEKAFEPKPEAAFTAPIDTSEAAEAKLDRELATVEAIAVEDPAEAPVVVETPAAEVPVVPVAPVESFPAEHADDTDAIATLEAAFAAPDSSEVTEVAPKRGELSHHDYHAQRPSEGIYRAGKSFKHTAGGPQGGKFASKEEYEDQTGIREFANGPVGLEESAQKHYDEVSGLNEAQPNTPERPSYETMDIDQLAFAAAKANMIGDKFVVDDIRNVYAEPFEEEYTRPGGELSLEDYEAAIARFDRLVEKATEYEKAKDPEHSALVDAAVERANKEPSFGDKLKGWWGKHKEGIKNVFRPSYWGERFTAAQMKMGEAGTWALNLGVNEEDDDQEKDRKRNRNRVIFIAGGAAVAVAGLAAATVGIGLAIGGNGEHHLGTEAANNVNGTGAGGSGTTGAETGGSGTGLSAQERAAQLATQPTGQEYTLEPVTGPTGAEQAAQDAAAQAAEAAAYTVPVDGTGEHLLTSLNIDPLKWYPNQEHLLKLSEGHMYRMTDGSVGLRPGLLPEAVRNAIKALK